MGSNIKFQQHSFNRLSKDRRFLAYFLHRHLEMEGGGLDELAGSLEAYPNDLFKLGNCLAPDPYADDFEKRIAAIAKFAEVNAGFLCDLVLQVSTLDRFARPEKKQGSRGTLMAARDKSEEE